MLTAAKLDGRIGEVAPVDRHGLQRPPAKLATGPDEMPAGLHARDGELAVFVDAPLGLPADRGIRGRRGDTHV